MPRLSKIGAAALAAFGWTSGSAVTADYLQIAGGGGGGGAAWAGGGGAGGLLSGTTSLNLTQSYTVTVGSGGAGGATGIRGTNGSNSQFGILTASVGGGGGAAGDSASFDGASGGSGGGGGSNFTGGSSTGTGGAGTSGQGNAGGNGGTDGLTFRAGGGGGGSGGVGGNNSSGTAGNGGAGTANSISGSSVTYAGGGGGAGNTANGTTTGGGGTAANSGTANTGGGGGGGVGTGSGGQGGSGVVIISYVGAQQFGGGVVTSSGGNTIHTFTTSGTLSPLSSLTASCLVVAGGGAGGLAYAGGGGAGGYRTGSGIIIDTNSIYAITVGAGGSGGSGSYQAGGDGSSSTFSAITSAGGGGGGAANVSNGRNGGSGGGGSGITNNGTGGTGNTPSTSPSQGNNGGNGAATSTTSAWGGGGGGGASAVGGTGSTSIAGAGGAGSSSSISGSSVTYSGGGGGGANAGYPGGAGGSGGGGAGGGDSPGTGSNNAANGTANLGGGGGGGGGSGQGATNVTSGNGGSGVVIISYPGSTQQMAGGTVTVAGGNVIHTFTSSGYLTPIVLVNNSLRFRSSASAYLNRTFGSPTNNNKWTWSGWVKRGALGTNSGLFGAFRTTIGVVQCYFMSNDTLRLYVNDDTNTTYIDYQTSAVYRDPSAWYHVVISIDNTLSTTSALIYINGTQVTAFGTNTNTLVQNAGLAWNFNGSAGYIGQNRNTSNAAFGYLDGYLAEVNFVDGQALTPFSFGTTSDLGVWQPIRYGGSYGTNGFYLPFTASSVTANYLVVAGGGGGGDTGGGGGGAGGFLTGTSALTVGASYTVTVGSGGTGSLYSSGGGSSGGNSTFSGPSTITSTGGGLGGGRYGSAPAIGGSGGGGMRDTGRITGAVGTAGQGSAGGNGPNGGAGGGGASAVGATTTNGQGGTGGAGTASSITGSSVTYAGGGGGGWNGTGTSAPGGAGGGGAGGAPSLAPGTAGTANTGGGGGGGADDGNGAAGGSGVVIISYAGSAKFTGGTITSSGGNTIHTFTSSGTLASNIAADYSPNGNNWTTNNISTTSGVTYDSMNDVPTLTSATASNFATFNPLMNFTGAFSATPTLSQANLLASGVADTKQYYADSTIQVSSGKWYAEFTPSAVTGDSSYVGIVTSSYLALYAPTGNYYNNSSWAAYGATYTTGDVIGVAYDADAGTITFYKNGTSQGQKTGITGTGALFRTSSYNTGASHSWTANFGQRPFSYTPPTGFVALNTFNLPTPTIGATASTTANKYFDVLTWTGNGASSRAITGLNFQPDWVWDKMRSDSYQHAIVDAVRGGNQVLHSNSTSAEDTNWTYGYVSSFNSNGFTIQAGSTSSENWNLNGSTFVAWNWRASNATAVTNTNGSIISSVSANTTSGFSIVTYTGNGANSTVGHGLGVVPSLYVVKRRNNVDGWFVYSNQLAATQYLRLNTTAAAATFNFWQDTAPTSSVFSISTDVSVNANSDTYVAYCFAPVAGYSAFGSYTGNGSTDGPFIFTGFRPRFVMTKRSDAIESWRIGDAARSPYNAVELELFANLSNAEENNSNPIDYLSNGFKIRTSSSSHNASGGTYIYMVFAENPFKYANAR